MIEKIDYDKYFVVKTEDLNDLNPLRAEQFKNIVFAIEEIRIKKGKEKIYPSYLVLNIDDDFDSKYLWNRLTDIGINKNVKIKDIAVHLINSILKLQS